MRRFSVCPSRATISNQRKQQQAQREGPTRQGQGMKDSQKSAGDSFPTWGP
ncbi:hypothetical protein GCM10020367_71100 [Streptomyces sannanensis]|uniref:Uncharacterized protein n=1 Tax=Streptomyces sannanensis TaxID=285536 RepID=A0ABP6SNS9_9ACTN